MSGSVSTSPSLDLDFTTGVMPSGLTFTRASIATNGFYTDAAGSTYTTYTANTPRFIGGGLYLEEARVNYLLNSDAPATQTVTLAAPAGIVHMLWVIGTGSATVTAGTGAGTGFGTATAGNPNYFTMTTAGTVVVTVTAPLTRFQLERAATTTTTFPTSYIPTVGAVVTRQLDLCTMPLGGWFNPAASTYYVQAMEPFFNPNACVPFAAYVGTTRSGLLHRASNNISVSDTVAGLVDMPGGFPPNGIIYQVAGAIRNGRQAGSMNGGTVGTLAAATIASGLTTLGVGSVNTTQLVLCGVIYRARYWPTDLANADLQAVTNAPTLDMDFTQGALPGALTFTRASTATYFDVTGTLQTGAINAPRFDYDPVAHTPRGLLIEESRTNSIRNSMMTGAVVGTPGTLPTNWTKASATGVAWNVIGTGVENGITYIDLELVGTSSAGIVNNMIFDSTTIIPASSGQVWTGTVYVKLLAGSLSGLQVSLNTSELPGGNQIGAIFTPTGAALATQRYTVTGTVTATGTSMVHFIKIIMPAAPSTVDVTLRIGAPQFELGAFATSFIPTTTVAVTRAIDSMTIASANMAPWFNAAGPGAWAIALTSFAASGAARRLINSASGTLIYPLWQRTGNDIGSLDGSATIFTTSTTQVGVPFKAASSWSSAPSGSICLNGGAVASGAQTIGFGALATTGVRFFSDGAAYNDCWVSRITYWPRALSSSELQAATSLLSGLSLDLNLFGPALDSRLTLTRSTTGTYVDATGTVQTAAINVPRFGYDPVSHAPLGLLIEETRTNLLTTSVALAGWATSPAACVLATDNVAVSPDGTTNASSVVTNDTALNGHDVYRPYTGAVSTTYCGSVFVKADSYPRVSVFFANSGFAAGSTGGLFDLTTGTLVAIANGSTCTITPYPNGWYRVSCTATSVASAGTYVFNICPAPSSVTLVSQNYTPASTGLGIFVWGPQVETAAFLTAPTSYIPTTAGTVTRAFDLCSMPTAAWYNASLGSFAVDGTMQQVNAGNQDIVGFDDGSINNCTIARVTSNQLYIVEASAGVGQASANTANTVLPGTPFRAAMTYNAGALTGSLNGGAVISSSGTAPVSTNRLNLSAIRQSAQNGFKSRVRYWPRVLANVELQEATSLGVQARAMVLA